MSLRTARAFAILWLMSALAVFALGSCMLIVSHWRDQGSSSVPSAVATAAYVEHGKTFYAPPNVLRWHDRLATALPTAMGIFVATSLIGLFMIPDEFIGRRWKPVRP